MPGVDITVDPAPRLRVVIRLPLLVDPLQVEQARAVDELVEHARRQQLRHRIGRLGHASPFGMNKPKPK